MKKYHRFMEHFWMAVAIGSALYCIFIMSTQGVEENWQLLVFPLMAGAMYVVRNNMRKRLERFEENEQNGSKNT